MSDLRIVSRKDAQAVTMDLLQTPVGLLDETQELATALTIALCTDRRALADDKLPNPDDDDRRGWWGDYQVEQLWAGWPIGSRLWLLSREKITGPRAKRGATIGRIETYVREALQPFVTNRLASRLDVSVERTALDRIEVVATLYRGPKPAISLLWQPLWDEIGGD